MSYKSIRPLMSKEYASKIGFSEKEMTGKDGIVVTDPKDYTDEELDFFKRLIKDSPDLCPDVMKEFLKNT